MYSLYIRWGNFEAEEGEGDISMGKWKESDKQV